MHLNTWRLKQTKNFLVQSVTTIQNSSLDNPILKSVKAVKTENAFNNNRLYFFSL